MDIFDSYPINKSLPVEVRLNILKLRESNVMVYNETEQDIKEQVLLDRLGNFVNFARLGYMLP